MQIRNRLIIIDPLKNIVILLKYMKVGLILNYLIQVAYLRLDENRTIGNEYFTNNFILHI